MGRILDWCPRCERASAMRLVSVDYRADGYVVDTRRCACGECVVDVREVWPMADALVMSAQREARA